MQLVEYKNDKYSKVIQVLSQIVRIVAGIPAKLNKRIYYKLNIIFSLYIMNRRKVIS